MSLRQKGKVDARPAGLAPWQDRLIDCVPTLNDGDDWLTAHWVLLRKVLGEPAHDAMALAHAFRHVPLTRATCEHVANGWHEDGSDTSGDHRTL